MKMLIGGEMKGTRDYQVDCSATAKQGIHDAHEARFAISQSFQF